MGGIGREEPLYIWHYDYYLSGKAPDAFSRFDPEHLADELTSTGANFIVVFALNQHGYAYYPSRIAPVHPSLGGLDYTGSMIRALQARDVTVITYVNFMNIERRQDHPEWWQRTSDGGQVYEGGWGVPCPNSPIREYMASIVQEVAQLYPTQGFFFDMYSFNRTGCWCDHCRDKFERQYGLPFPLAEDWGSESWIKYIEFRYRSATETMAHIRDAAKSVRPDLIWVTHCGPHSNWWRGTGTLGPTLDDMLQSEVGTYYGRGRWAGGYRAKLMQPYTAGQQVVVILADTHRDMSGERPRGWFYIPWSETQLKRGVAEIVAHGAWPDIYTEPYPDGRNNPYTVRGIKAAFDMARRFEPYLVGSESVKSVALHYSRPSLDFYGRGQPQDYLHSFDGTYKALMESHIPFDVVMDQQILDGRIRDYDLLVLPNSACTSDALADAISDYVGAGGSLLATYKTSLFDEVGRRRPDLALSDLLGIRYRRDYEPSYLEAGPALSEGLTGSPVIQHRLARVEALEGTEAMATVVALSPTDLAPFTYVAAPVLSTDWPAITRRGQAIYCAGDLGFSFIRAGYPDHPRLLANCVAQLIGDRLPLKVKAPGTVDVSLRRQGDRALVHLVNLTTNQIVEDAGCEIGGYEAIPVPDIEVRLRTARPLRASLASTGEELPAEVDGGWQSVTVPRLDIYDIVVFES
ncbi:MAG: hypothetical protein HPY83_11290 [Anaerolineae bacterium]|nr:hypothetical protein [Anaerolineae bacterium]